MMWSVVDECLGCDVVLDADQTLVDVHNGDDLENFDTVLDNIQTEQLNAELTIAPASPAA